MRITANQLFSSLPAPRDGTSGQRPAAVEPARVSLPAVIQPLPRATAEAPPPRSRPSAPLIAQLIANSENLPSARSRRREDPAVGSGIYRTMASAAPDAAPRENFLV
jgi:hypothetical protein